MRFLLILTMLFAVSCGYSPRHDRHESTTIAQPEVCCEDCRTKVKCSDPCKTDCKKQEQTQSQKQKVIIEVKQPEWDYEPQPEPKDQNVDIDIDIDIDSCQPCVKDEPCILISNDNANTNNNVNNNVNTNTNVNGNVQQCKG